MRSQWRRDKFEHENRASPVRLKTYQQAFVSNSVSTSRLPCCCLVLLLAYAQTDCSSVRRKCHFFPGACLDYFKVCFQRILWASLAVSVPKTADSGRSKGLFAVPTHQTDKGYLTTDHVGSPDALLHLYGIRLKLTALSSVTINQTLPITPIHLCESRSWFCLRLV